MKVKKGIIFALQLLFTTVLVVAFIQFKQNNLTVQGANSKTNEYQVIHYDLDDYLEYLERYDQVFPNKTIVIEAEDYFELSDEENFRVVEADEYGHPALFTDEEGTVTWKFNVDQAGLYNIKIVYYPVEGKTSNIERTIWVNNEIPFRQARNIVFSRVWADEFNVLENREKKKRDKKPPQIEQPEWRESVVKDVEGYYGDPFKFFFNQGENTIRFEALREPMVIDKIILYQEETLKTYEEVKAEYERLGYQKVEGKVIAKVQGEDSIKKSSPTLFPIADRSSRRTEPYSSRYERLNHIGGINWRVNGDWIEWKFNVPETGLYKISIKARQNFNRGSFSTRTLRIDGNIPFEEAKQIEFNYNGDWKNYTLGNGEEDYYFYLTEGEHTISLEVTLGRYAELINDVEKITQNLNSLYREIIMFTGVSPDPYRDYQLEKRIPDLKEQLQSNIDALDSVISRIVDISGSRSDKIASLEKTRVQLEDFHDNTYKIQTRLIEFKENISSLGTWILTTKEQPLSIDYIMIHSANYKLPRAHTNFFEKLWHEIVLFFYSFFKDDTFLQSEETGDRGEIEVWLTSGRDQANVLRQLIDETFTPDTGITVNLKLVNANVLLPATLTGRGPDVAMMVAEDLPVNYAMRNAIYDISQFDDFEEIKGRFKPSALTPFEYNGGYYALPDTQTFLIMFYRTDILAELNLTPPKTWDDVINMIPILQRHNLEFYLPSTVPMMYTLVKQKGGELYNEDGSEVAMMSEEGTEAFVEFTSYYTHYGFTVAANFTNRFRTGEMPIGISDYSMYNTLSVFAPEIRGNWAFAPIPGTRREDGSIDNTSVSTSTGVVMLKDTKHPDLAWEYMKWWTSTETQVQYAREMEGILGAAARYPTANVEALEQLPWPTKELRILQEQHDNTAGMPVVPGSYITPRYLDHAFRQVLNDGTNPRDALYYYSRRINDELKRKRLEFGLD